MYLQTINLVIMSKYIVVEPWKETFENPITIFGGQEVMVDNSKTDDDPDWQGWVWAVSSDNSGWVPMQILTVVEETDDHLWRASVNEDYTAKELTISKDEVLEGDNILNGWLWARKADSVEEGWVPLKCLRRI